MTDNHVVGDGAFWQGVLALIAIVLSQCPPIRLWFKRARLEVDCFNRIALDENIGTPSAQWHLTITNAGGREVKINQIHVSIKRGTEGRELVARSYFEAPTDKTGTLLTPFRLKPKDEWRHNTSFFNPPSREDRRATGKYMSTLRADILAKRARLPKDHPDIEADPRIVQPVQAAFDANFFWDAGEYEIELHIKTDSAKADVKQSFRLTLFESDSQELHTHRDQLKFGNGVFYRAPPVEPYFVELHPNAEGRT